MTTRVKHGLLTKLTAMARQARCPLCGEKLGPLDGLDWDHETALALGGADDASNLRAVHRACHRIKTSGNGATSAGSDIQIIAKSKRIAGKKADRFRSLPTGADVLVPAISEAGGAGMSNRLAYYNENDRVAAHVLRCLIDDGIIAPGIVDDRSIKEVEPDDLRGFAQCHFFAGAGTWSVAARLAGWADERPLWTASCPCQPFSAAGKGDGTDDPRHLWPDLLRLVRGAKAGGFGPAVIMGEQVSGKAGYGWFDGVRADLAEEGYASRARDIPALAIDGPHQRNRLYWIAVADANAGGCAGRAEGTEWGAVERDAAERPADEYLAFTQHSREGRRGLCGLGESTGADSERPSSEPARSDAGRHVTLGDAFSAGLERHAGHGDERGRSIEAGSVAAADGGDVGHAQRPEWWPSEHAGRGSDQPETNGRFESSDRLAQPASALVARNGSFWSDAEWIICHDGKARRTKPDLRLLVDGMAGRIHLWRLAGNSIVAEEAAEVIRAFMDAEAQVAA